MLRSANPKLALGSWFYQFGVGSRSSIVLLAAGRELREPVPASAIRPTAGMDGIATTHRREGFRIYLFRQAILELRCHSMEVFRFALTFPGCPHVAKLLPFGVGTSLQMVSRV